VSIELKYVTAIPLLQLRELRIVKGIKPIIIRVAADTAQNFTEYV